MDTPTNTIGILLDWLAQAKVLGSNSRHGQPHFIAARDVSVLEQKYFPMSVMAVKHFGLCTAGDRIPSFLSLYSISRGNSKQLGKFPIAIQALPESFQCREHRWVNNLALV